MKRILSYITASMAVLCVAAMTGCSTDPGTEGEGRLVINPSWGIMSRGGGETPENVAVKIGKPGVGYTHVFENGATVPSELWLTAGSWVAQVTASSYTAPGWGDGVCYKGTANFTITAGRTERVNVECRVQNTFLSIEFDESVPKYLKDYSATIFPVAGDATKKLVFDASNVGAKANFVLDQDQTAVDLVFAATHITESSENPSFPQTKKLENLAPGKHYTATIKYFKAGGTLGPIEITVDESTKDIGHDIIVSPPKPVIQGIDFSKPVLPTGDRKLTITSGIGLKYIMLTGRLFGAPINLIGESAATATDLDSKGIAVEPVESGYEVTFAAKFFELAVDKPMAADLKGQINAYDVKNQRTKEDIIVGLGYINGMSATDVWATHAKVTGFALKEGARFAWRVVPDGDWLYVDAARNPETNACSATLTGLTPATKYEFDIEVGGLLSGTPQIFTTEAATTLYNGDFEAWNQNDGVWYANATGVAFWDSGNKGVVKAPWVGKPTNNRTVSDDDVRPGSTGSKSAKIQSDAFAGVFAAGNIYSGNFLSVKANLSNPSGKIELGRPFTSRPSAMKVWYKGATGKVTHAKENAPLQKDDQDIYRILVALSDRGSMREVDTADWGTLVNFDTDPDILAWGSIEGSENVDWTNATIKLKYKSTTRKPTHIIVMANASKYGDYFAGSTSSWMKLDDFELVYDENIVVE